MLCAPDQLEQQRVLTVKLLCCVKRVSSRAENIFVKIYPCLLQIDSHWCKQNRAVCLVLFFFLYADKNIHTHAGTPSLLSLCLRFQSPIPHRRQHFFHLGRPAVFLLDDTAAPANELQHRDISDISSNLTFMGLVFLPHFTWNSFGFQCPCITPWRLSGKVWVSNWAVVRFFFFFFLKKIHLENLKPFFLGTGHFCALREATGEMCIPTRPWLAFCWRLNSYVYLLFRHHHPQPSTGPKKKTLLLEQV